MTETGFHKKKRSLGLSQFNHFQNLGMQNLKELKLKKRKGSHSI